MMIIQKKVKDVLEVFMKQQEKDIIVESRWPRWDVTVKCTGAAVLKRWHMPEDPSEADFRQKKVCMVFS